MRKFSSLREAPAPIEGPIIGTVIGGTVIWFVLFLIQLPFYGWLDDHGHLWWLWTCLAGGGLGFIGIWYVRARDTAIRRAAGDQPDTGAGAEPRTDKTPQASAADTPDTR
ncbi:DUF2530 domain-containing protein [Streptomyces sp. H27-D2]|uniref:DUF2530 domain-containing protein n=1 Tax=Streptomyces sp. H27-D2 TaxID=3046304 RepID=UPI002DB8ED36|nr:DUF2530 domain-containing protein [Streptomyces sp. H27-D2]MEC4016841.1 DUF2530 domain-containing protein [Streptomyces sp. H27-D2]